MLENYRPTQNETLTFVNYDFKVDDEIAIAFSCINIICLMEFTYWNFWKLDCSPEGRQVWKFNPPEPYNGFSEEQWAGETGKKFLEEMSKAFTWQKSSNANSGDKIYRIQTTNNKRQTINDNELGESLNSAISFYGQLQAESGHWPGDYGGPMFLLPGLVIASYVTESPLPAPHRSLIKQYFLNHQNEDGGWGLHLESPSTMFATVLQYVALRILGADGEGTVKARNWIKSNGGATGIPSWGKFYLSVLGVYEWKGCNSLFPEMWLLPKWLPFHPSRYWCHARMVYLPMSYCFGHSVTAKKTKLIDALREELYDGPYAKIDWTKTRNECAVTDLYYPQSTALKFLNRFLSIYERVPFKWLRKRALNFILDYTNAEDQQTNYIDIGPVNQVINSIAVWHAYGKDSEQFKKHYERWFDYLWLAEDGMKMQGYNGSQLWDTAFATQAILESGREDDFTDVIEKAYSYLDVSQVKNEVGEHTKYFRHDSVGGWPFSTVDHGWPITDCTAEGLKTTLLIHERNILPGKKISEKRIKQAADLILSFQNKDGGWATYERTRGPAWLELLNPSEVFGNIMIDYSYTECTSACVQALLRFRKNYPEHKSKQIADAVNNGIEFILQQQRIDGSWYGSWAVCFTYGTWFGTEALSQYIQSCDEQVTIKSKILYQRSKESLQRACEFLISKQNDDGGWGESFESCIKKEYIPSVESQVVNTSWAILSLLASDYESKEAIEKGINLLLKRQQPNGDWLQENISGVFNHNCMITYTSYRNVFPIWALGRYTRLYGDRFSETVNEERKFHWII